MENTMRLLLADDHRLFTEGLVYIITKHFPHAIVTTCESGEEAWSRINGGEQFDMLITDLSMPGMSGLELTTCVKRDFPSIKVLVLTMHNEREMIHAILKAEAEGYVLKNSTAKDISRAIADIMNNTTHYGKEVLSAMLLQIQGQTKKQEVRKVLTERELEVLQLIIEEYSSDEIAEKLAIGKRTIDTHRANILDKTGCKNIVSLIKYAIRHDMVKI
jgi:DNA-binding NarL/FixJ family response regulator